MKKSGIRILVVALILIISANIFSQNKKIIPSKQITVYVFLSETCPICQSYTLTLKEFYKHYSEMNVHFVGVFPNYFSSQKGIEEFKTKYSIPFECIMDKGGQLTKHFQATITPEVFVEDETKQILYCGRIDDSFFALGKRRTVVTTNELADALKQISSGQSIKTTKTQAIGCVINLSK